jgi:hypothetical protein
MVTGSNNGAALAAAATERPNNTPTAVLPIDLDIILVAPGSEVDSLDASRPGLPGLAIRPVQRM